MHLVNEHVSEQLTASIFRVEVFYPEDEDNVMQKSWHLSKRQQMTDQEMLPPGGGGPF